MTLTPKQGLLAFAAMLMASVAFLVWLCADSPAPLAPSVADAIAKKKAAQRVVEYVYDADTLERRSR